MIKRFISFSLILVIIFSILVGCSIGDTAVEDTLEENEVEEVNTAEEVDETIEVVDMAGRTITLPKPANRVFATRPTGTILLYTLNPDKMIGWNYDLRDGEKQFIPEKYHNLPNLGGSGKNAVNIEELLKLDPDVLIIMEEVIEKSLSDAEELEQKTGKPTIILDSDLLKLDEAYEILGKIIGEEERAKELADYCRKAIEEVQNLAKDISDDERIGVYYAQGPDGLETEPSGSWHAAIIDLVGGRNVAEVEAKADTGKSLVSIEQLLNWNPDLIISWDDERGGYYSRIFEDSTWQSIKAVENEEVYEIPNRPFNWFDRPPSVNRILGLRWLGNLIYPEVFNYDVSEVVTEFYSKFYHYELSDDELVDLLKNSTRH
ncbi:ABC transporter substrate-binding protein [Tepidimicrobium xylanilyticum]